MFIEYDVRENIPASLLVERLSVSSTDPGSLTSHNLITTLLRNLLCIIVSLWMF